MPDTIRAKIMVLTGGLSLLLMFGFGFFLYTSLRVELFQFVDHNLRDRADLLMDSLKVENGQARFDRGEISDRSLLDDDSAQLIALDGVLFDRLGKEYVPSIASEKNPTGFQTYRFWEEEGTARRMDLEIFRLLIVPVSDHEKIVAYLQVGREIPEIQEALTRLLQLLLLSGPVMVGVSSVGGYWLAGKSLAPIEKIRQKAASIKATDLHTRLDQTHKDEVGQLAGTFNEMLDRLEDSFQRQRRFTSDASHELRTPLSIIRGEVDVALERARTPEAYVETLQSIGAEAQRMSRLVNELLLLARADSNELHLAYEKVDTADLLRLLVGNLQSQAQAAGVRLKMDLPASLIITADRDHLIQLFINLLENAFIHAPGSQVSIQARTAGGQAEFILADTGPGIAPEHLPNIFDRFYRVDPVRGSASRGTGLGLAIAREIITAHGGTICMQSEPGKGTLIKILLPAG